MLRSFRVQRSVLFLSLAIVLCPARESPASRKFNPASMDTFLYGAAFYEEYMPADRLEKDVELMQQAGINVVRVGESTWSLWEPEDGSFEFAWMDRIINRLERAHIQVILGTPTYSIPPWLYKEHPDILVTRLGGQKATYGMRQNMDITNPDFLRYSERVIRKIAEHYKSNPAVIGWQIDNETTSNGTAGANAQAGFASYLREKFGTVNQLNKIWGLVYWGQSLSSWSDLPPEDGIINPGWKLEWERYQELLTTKYLNWQASILRDYLRPDQFITQDFGGAAKAEVNEAAISQPLDIAAMNTYHPSQDLYDGQDSSFAGDYTRSLKQTNFLITETNAQTIGWDSRFQFPPYDGQLREDVYTFASTGANMVEYWHWHSNHYGQETYWKGILSHDLEPGRIYGEVSKTAHELQRIGRDIVDVKHQNSVAVLYSNDSRHGIEYMPFLQTPVTPNMPWGSFGGYDLELHRLYGALYRLNLGIDFIFPETEDLGRYKLIVVPPLYIASDELLQRLVDYVQNGGHLLLTLKSGFCNQYSTVRDTLAPGPLRQAAGFHYQEFSNLVAPLHLKGDPFQAGAANLVSDWAEMLVPDTAKPLAYYDHEFFGKYPAITENRFGKGITLYEGTVLSEDLQLHVLEHLISEAGLLGPDQSLPASVRVRHGSNRAGKALHYFLNYSGQTQSFTYAYKPGIELLNNRPLAASATLSLPAWGVAIVEEDGVRD